MKKRLLLKDIAKALGVSVTTVSFVVNNKAEENRISEAVTKRIQDYVKKVGYKTNQLAKGLRTGESRLLGLLVEDIANPYFSQVAKHLERHAYKAGYHIIHSSMDNDDQRARELIQLFVDRQVDGLIITPSANLEHTVTELKQAKIPLVLFDRYLPSVETSYVVSDDRGGGYAATKHLLESGSQRIGLISFYSNQTQMKGRQEGYLQAMDELRKQSFIAKLHLDSEDEQQIYNFVVDNKLDAIFFATNYLAVKGLKVFRTRGIALPKIVSFDDHTLFELHDPSISAVSQDIELLTKNVIQTLIADIEGKLNGFQQKLVPCELIVRDSSTDSGGQTS